LFSWLPLGILYLRLHALPEHLAHRNKRIQFEIVCVLGLLSMFTGEHLFWISGLLLALIDIPDFSGPMRRIAGSMEKVAGLPPGGGSSESPPMHAGRPHDDPVAIASRQASSENPP
jgi:hypothetical protein